MLLLLGPLVLPLVLLQVVGQAGRLLDVLKALGEWLGFMACLTVMLRQQRQLEDRQELKWMQLKALLTFKTRSKGEGWATTLGWFIPRKYRHVIGDILEDCAEMREAGCTERRIKFHVVYQWVIAVIMLVPTAVKTSIVDAVRQALSRPR
jgi:hypothetical protein